MIESLSLVPPVALDVEILRGLELAVVSTVLNIHFMCRLFIPHINSFSKFKSFFYSYSTGTGKELAFYY